MTTVRLHAVAVPFTLRDRYVLRRAAAFVEDLRGENARWLGDALHHLNRTLDDRDWYGAPGQYRETPTVLAAACEHLAGSVVRGIPRVLGDPHPGRRDRHELLLAASVVLLAHPILPADEGADYGYVPAPRRLGDGPCRGTRHCLNANRYQPHIAGCYC